MSASSTSYQPDFEVETIAAGVPAWKAELNAKLAAHRQRSGAPGRQTSESPALHEEAREGSKSSVAARVAARYAKAPSYSEFLAASAAASAAAAETAAFAARQAQEAAQAHALLAAAAGEHAQAEARAPVDPSPHQLSHGPGQAWPETATSSLWATVEHPEPLPARGMVPPRPSEPAHGHFGKAAGIVDAMAEAMVPPAVTLPAKLIEFPRELVAARKSRPRIAEGPLADERAAPLFAEAESRSLRIFEVDGDAAGATTAADPGSGETGATVANGRQSGVGETETGGHSQGYPGPGLFSSYPGEELRGAAPEWQPIRLGEHPAEFETASDPLQSQLRSTPAVIVQAASLADRTMAALVDLGLVGMAFVLFVLVFAACTAHPPMTKTALGCGAVVLGGLFLFYEWLFMSFGGDTPGMRYARIALCTFEDENPTRTMRRKRLAARLLAALPLGLGILWALFDEDGLGWHDRMSRSYQRSYR